MIVVDTNVVAYYCVPGPLTEAAWKLAKRDLDWHAPFLWRSEFQSMLVGEVRRNQINWPRAEAALAVAERRMGERGHFVQGADVLRLAMQSRCSAYDLEFVALAQRLQVPLITLDRQILREFPDLARPLA